MTSQEIARDLQRKRGELAHLLEKHCVGEKAGLPEYDFPDGVEQEVDERQNELNTLQDDFTRTKRAEIARNNLDALTDLTTLNRRVINADGKAPVGNQNKTLSDLVTSSYQYKNRAQTRNLFSIDFDDFDLKTLLTTAGTPGYAPPNPRTDIALPYLIQPVNVTQIIPTVTTDKSEISWMEETTFTNNASMTGEGYSKPESTVDWDEKTTTVRKVATYVAATEEQVDDVPQFMQLIQNDLTRMIQAKQEDQILNGTGIGQEITGILQNASIQTQALTVNNADTVFAGITKIGWTGFGNASHVVLNPANWQTLRVLKGATNQDYVLGSPLIDVTPRLWGLPVVLSNRIASGTGLVGDFAMGATIFLKMGLKIDVSDSHSTYFVENKLAIRAELRFALQIKRPAFFVKLTGLT